MVGSMNFSASIHNLTQMDRFQQDSHKAPIVNQQQNAEKAAHEISQRVEMPVQPDHVEEKTINPDKKKNHNTKGKKKKKPQLPVSRPVNLRGDTGRFVDFSV